MLLQNISPCVFLSESTPDSHRTVCLNQRNGSQNKVIYFSRCIFILREQDYNAKEPPEKLCKNDVIFPQVRGSNYGATPLTTHLTQATPGSHWQRGRQVDVLPAEDDQCNCSSLILVHRFQTGWGSRLSLPAEKSLPLSHTI